MTTNTLFDPQCRFSLFLLGNSLDGQDESETLIDQATQALKNATVESVKDVMKKPFSIGLSATGMRV